MAVRQARIVRMKIIVVKPKDAAHNKGAEAALLTAGRIVAHTKPDSALLRGGKPFFIPDGIGAIRYAGAVAARMCRLGKSIPERFAHRYYDALTVGIDFEAEGPEAWGDVIRTGFDGAAVIGEWTAKEAFVDVRALRVRVAINGIAAPGTLTGSMSPRIDEAIAYISRYMTIKTGDIFFMDTPGATGRVSIDDHVTGWIDDRKVLEFNCK